MQSIIAEVAVNATGKDLLVWLACAACVFIAMAAITSFFNQAVKAKQNLSGHPAVTEIAPQPLDVRMVHDLVRKDECISRHSESVAGLSAVRRDVDELRRERKADTTELHDKINKVAIEVGGLSKSTEMQNQRLAQMDGKLDRLVEKRLERM
ncbi:MAG TPA: hypothetical protein VLT16_00575 [Candidatus Limnocylindrales bacterium]|nr:hypothetical protein [Candidatus Limnocylindrales bacterium]